jgi:hypothetical protein
MFAVLAVCLTGCGSTQLSDVEGTGAAYNRSTDPVDVIVDGRNLGTLKPAGTSKFSFPVPVQSSLGLVDPATSHTANVSVAFINRRTSIPTQPTSCSAGTATVTQMVYHPATSSYSSDWAECWSSQSYDRLPVKDSLRIFAK